MGEINIVLAVVGVLLSASTFFLGRTTSAKNSGQEWGVILTEIGYIKSGVDDMKKKMEQSDRRYLELTERVTALEEVVKIYHREV